MFSNQIKRLVPSSFSCLNIAQFLGAFNDQFYKGLAIYLLLDLTDPNKKSAILALAGALFVIPFLIFLPTAGKLADRFSKSQIIFWAKSAEILVMSAGLAAFTARSFFGAMAVLILMAAQSAFFGPSKYGIIPELVDRQHITRANAWLAMFTNLAVVTGTGFAGFIGQYWQRDLILGGSICVVIAIIGTVATLGITPTTAKGGSKELSLKFWREISLNFKKAARYGHLQTFLLAYFIAFHIAGFLQLNLIPYCIDELGKSDAAGNWFFAYTAIGIGVGALLAGYFNQRELKLHHMPIAVMAASLSLAGLALWPNREVAVLICLELTGICMGFFVVPSESYLQLNAPAEDRGEILATSNFLSFAGIFVAAGSLYLLGDVLGIGPAARFGIYSLGTLISGIALRRKLLKSAI